MNVHMRYGSPSVLRNALRKIQVYQGMLIFSYQMRIDESEWRDQVDNWNIEWHK